MKIVANIHEEPCSDVSSLDAYFASLELLRHDLRRKPRDE